MPLLLGIDVGTSAVKAGVLTPDGRLLGLGRAAYHTTAPQPGWAECDPDAWWRALLVAWHAALHHAGRRPQEIGAVGLGVLFPCVMPLDATGRALHPALLYNDGRSLAQVRRLTRRLPRPGYEARTGNVLMPGTSAVTSIAWLLAERPEIMRRARCIGWANTYLTARLTGEIATDGSMAALSGLVEAADPWHWSAELCANAGLDPARLPPIRAADAVCGTVTAAAARATGLRRGTPVVCGCGDVPAAALGAGVLTGDSAAYVAGSTDCVAWPRTAPAPGLKWVNCAYLRPGRWLAIGTATSAGVSVEWFARTVLGRVGRDGVTAMTRLAAGSPPGSRGVLFLPYLQGERTPVWDPQARGLFFGLRADTTRADLARAVFEGTAFALRDILLSLAAAGTRLPRLRAVGGCTANAFWNQVKADVLGRELRILGCQDTGVLGAALLAGTACGVVRGPAEAAAVARAAVPTTAVRPNPALAVRYADSFARYRRLYPRLRPLLPR